MKSLPDQQRKTAAQPHAKNREIQKWIMAGGGEAAEICRNPQTKPGETSTKQEGQVPNRLNREPARNRKHRGAANTALAF